MNNSSKRASVPVLASLAIPALIFGAVMSILPSGFVSSAQTSRVTSRTDICADALALIDGGDYAAAKALLGQRLNSLQKSRRPARECYLMGVACYELGEYAEARSWLLEAREKGFADADLYLGRLSFLNYNFPDAGRLYGQYAARKGTTARELDDFRRELATATRALNAVEDITVIDSIAIDANDFFSVYNLSPASGRVVSPDAIPFEYGRGYATTAFASERGDFMMWAEPDSLGVVRIAESIRLTDGSWHEPILAPESLNMGGDADFPFMMPDGLTLYFASDGDGSMGGLDIFVASRDAGTGEYLEPRNMGMPYNSPYDDFMLAIDELNGIGWWATDRNLLGDKVTVYVYQLNDMRRNLDPESEDITNRARLRPWRTSVKTKPEEGSSDSDSDDEVADTTLRDNVSAPLPAAIPQLDKTPDFTFPVSGGHILHFWSDLSSDESRRLMQEYLTLESRLREEEAKLADLRRKYHAGSAKQRSSLVQAIIPYEKAIPEYRNRLRSLRSNIVQAETK